MKIAILYICTGKYNIFWKDFYTSCEKNFIPNSEKHYFVFTDAENIDFEKVNSLFPKLYYEDYKQKFTISKQDLLDVV